MKTKAMKEALPNEQFVLKAILEAHQTAKDLLSTVTKLPHKTENGEDVLAKDNHDMVAIATVFMNVRDAYITLLPLTRNNEELLRNHGINPRTSGNLPW